MAYLNRRRAERAAMLLATTDTPVGSIGTEVGWADPSQFSTRFRQHLDMSPHEYRVRSRRHYARVAAALASMPRRANGPHPRSADG